MDVNDDHVQTLLAMGFPSESEIRRALQIGKNDLNEAVSILTNESFITGYENLDELDVEMKDVQTSSSRSSMYPPPPSYDEVLTIEGNGGKDEDNDDQKGCATEETGLEFPTANLTELEDRVFVESWSIPYKREESLAKCLTAATRLAHEGLLEKDEQCMRFIERSMPECFNKLLDSTAVHRWNKDIQEGIYDMLVLFIDLVATRLHHQPVPIGLLKVLAQAFNPDTEFHMKNKACKPDKSFWEEKLGVGNLYAISPTPGQYKDFGNLTNLINRFAVAEGFDCIRENLAREDLEATTLAALLAPLGSCAEYLHGKVVLPLLGPGMQAAANYVKGLTEDDRKQKSVGVVSELLASMKLLCLALWPQDVQSIDDLRLEVALSMLKSPHFNAKMNALKEVTKLIEDSTNSRPVKTAIPADKIIEWMVESQVLSIALEGNIDQGQYCDKIKNIVDFLGSSLSPDELTKIWKIQVGQNNVVVDNIHSIIAAAGVKFNAQLLEHLFSLIQITWNSARNATKEKLLNLIGRIGRDSTQIRTTQKVLELLWDLAHLPQLSTPLIDLALEEHLSILSDPKANVKEQLKRTYVVKCVDDIKEGKWVLPALKQLLQIAKNIAKNSYNKAEKGILQELNKSYDIIKQVTTSLVKLHQQALENTTTLTPETLVDRRYMHKDYVTVQLQFLQFILQEGVLYLPTKCAKTIWATLIANPDACDWDRDTCFDWLRVGISDLEQDVQSQLFQQEFLKLTPEKLSTAGFRCFKLFFENVNVYEHRMKKIAGTITVEKTDLLGVDFLWEVCLNTPSEEISESAISLLISMSYTNLTHRIKKDSVALHKKFIDACYKRLEMARLPLGGSLVAHCLMDATRIISSIAVFDVNSLPSPSKQSNLLSIERLLLLAECYVTTVEEQHNYPRTILAHGAAFQGQPLSLFVTCEAPKMDFNITVHSNETVGSLRHKIAAKLNSSADNVQIVINDKVLNKEQKLLHQLDVEDNQVVSARTYTPPSVSSSSMALVPVSSTSSSMSTSSPPPAGTDASSVILSSIHGAGGGGGQGMGAGGKLTFELEQERQLPGVVMAMGGYVFDMLYTLADLDEPKITSRARNLLKLIPTDPSVKDTLESLGHKAPRQHTPEPPSPKLSPRNSPRKGGSGASSTGLAGTLTPSTSSGSLAGNRSSKEVLHALFDPSAPDMSTFRVLYNLEVLSSQLMPTVREPSVLQAAAAFCPSFLAADGLALVVRTLQRHATPGTDDYSSRQGCYAIALQLLRFLLCGQEVTGESFHSALARRSICSMETGGAGSGAGGVSTDTPLTVDVSAPAVACKAIQIMSVSEFTETVGCFVRVAWAAAAGNLQLANSTSLPDTSVSSDSGGGGRAGLRSRQSSTGSNTSSGSGDEQSLNAGVCARRNSKVSARDATIAKEAIELLVTCLQLRNQLLSSFYSIACASDFIIDLLVGCSSDDIRDTALDQFYLLSQTVVPTDQMAEPAVRSPHHYMLHTLLKAHLPFWVQSSSTRGASQKALRRCKQYFELRCRLLQNLTESQQQKLGVNVASMLDDEIGWLHNFVPSDATRGTDNTLLAGHLRLIHTLLTCQSVDKKEIGTSVIHNMLHDLLFPASKLIMDSSVALNNSGASTDISEQSPASTFQHMCTRPDSRVAAYEVLAELSAGVLENLRGICQELSCMHHHHAADPEGATQWDYSPPVASRSAAGFVGLKNGGATCYMNSVLQQLFMTPGVVEGILGVEDTAEGEDETVLYQLQTVLGHLLESKLQYYKPEHFWKVFKLWGQAINIREQQDAFDFYTALLDQVEERVKMLGKDSVFKKKFEGIYSDQKICKGCPHKYEREEVFYALNVTVKNATLQDSLAQFVKGELLDGDNQYFCEKCGEKRDTIKRMCIKSLPSTLCIQLKRFSWDWETNRALKFDDYFKFPWSLDMEPYTAEGLARQEQAEAALAAAGEESSSSSDGGDGATAAGSGDAGLSVNTTAAVNTASQIHYELVGVVVHSGQANAGHYYSLIKDRRGNHMTNQTKGKWFKFNDCDVDEFEMTDTSIETECFGGTYKTKVFEQSSSFPEERLRYWNGYLLFYERVEEIRTPMSAKKSRVSLRTKPHGEMASASSASKRSSDSFVELTALVHKGEKRGLFAEQMPARIQQVVRAENLRYMKNRDIYDADYFRFVRHLVEKNLPPPHPSENGGSVSSQNSPAIEEDKQAAELATRSAEMGMTFLCHTYLRSKASLRADLNEWVSLMSKMVRRSKAACMWMVEYLSTSPGAPFIKPFLLECPIVAVREAFSQILDATIHSFFQHGGVAINKCFNELIEVLLTMVDKDVPDNCKTCKEYFSVLMHYVAQGTKACSHMFGKQAVSRLARFLLGPPGSEGRRWSSLQAQLFGPLHATLATLVLNCDVTPFRTVAPKEFPIVRPTTVTPQIVLKMSADMQAVVLSQRYLTEVVLAVRELGKSTPPELLDMLLYVSFCNSSFTMNVIKFIMRQYTNAPSNELTGLLQVLASLLTLQDPLQLKRLQCVIDGYLDDTDTQFDGMLTVIKSNAASDSRRSYQLIKFLVSLSTKCSPAKDYLLQSPINWQWSVNWLKKKMTEHYWSPTTASTMSNEDSSSKTFQRTISAQTTLEEATDLLKEFEAHDSPVAMDTDPEPTIESGDLQGDPINISSDNSPSPTKTDKGDVKLW